MLAMGWLFDAESLSNLHRVCRFKIMLKYSGESGCFKEVDENRRLWLIKFVWFQVRPFPKNAFFSPSIWRRGKKKKHSLKCNFSVICYGLRMWFPDKWNFNVNRNISGSITQYESLWNNLKYS